MSCDLKARECSSISKSNNVMHCSILDLHDPNVSLPTCNYSFLSILFWKLLGMLS